MFKRFYNWLKGPFWGDSGFFEDMTDAEQRGLWEHLLNSNPTSEVYRRLSFHLAKRWVNESNRLKAFFEAAEFQEVDKLKEMSSKDLQRLGRMVADRIRELVPNPIPLTRQSLLMQQLLQRFVLWACEGFEKVDPADEESRDRYRAYLNVFKPQEFDISVKYNEEVWTEDTYGTFLEVAIIDGTTAWVYRIDLKERRVYNKIADEVVDVFNVRWYVSM